MAFYAGLAWFPEILQASGWSATSAGALQALANLVSAAPALAVPLLVAHGVPPRRLLFAVVVLVGGGVVGLLAWPESAPASMLAIGLGQGGFLGLGLMLPTLVASDADDLTRLTAATFSGGFLIAALGPSLLGLAHDASGGWELPLAGVLAVTLAALVPGLRAIPPKT
jgi:CP family cyanate transporter-like MFS transporter